MSDFKCDSDDCGGWVCIYHGLRHEVKEYIDKLEVEPYGYWVPLSEHIGFRDLVRDLLNDDVRLHGTFYERAVALLKESDNAED